MGTKADIIKIIKAEVPGCISEHERDSHDKMHPADIERLAKALAAYMKKKR